MTDTADTADDTAARQPATEPEATAVRADTAAPVAAEPEGGLPADAPAPEIPKMSRWTIFVFLVKHFAGKAKSAVLPKRSQ